LHHTSTHVGCGRADTAAQTAQIEIGGSQIGSKVAAAVMGGVEQSATEKNVHLQENDEINDKIKFFNITRENSKSYVLN